MTASLLFLLACVAGVLLGFLLLTQYGPTIRLLTLMRVPIVFAAFGFLAPVVAQLTGLTILRNMFILERPRDLYAVALLGILNSWLCGLCWLLIWEYGLERIGEPARRLPRFWAERRLVRILPSTLLAVPLLVMICRHAHGFGWQAPLAAALGSTVVAFCLLAIVRQLVLSGGNLQSEATLVQRLWARVPLSIAAGYYNPAKQRMHPGHGTAAAFSFLLALAYLFGEVFLDPRLSAEPPLPALAYLLVLSMLLVSVLSGAAFFFDRYRVPLVITIAGWYMLSYVGPATDHTFTVYPLAAERNVRVPPVATAVEAWRTREVARHPQESRPPIVIICASGGGIQASAWTTRVVTWLIESLEQEQPGLGAKFARSVRLVSSTSGGSVGSLYLWEAYRRNGDALATDAEMLQAVRDAGSRSSLAETGWGLVYPDFQRAFLPLAVDERVDRAWAMEQAWKRSLDADQPLNARLSDWVVTAADGRMPAVAMNAFLVETGDRLLLSSVDIQGTRRARSFARLYGTQPADDLRATPGVSTSLQAASNRDNIVTQVVFTHGDNQHANGSLLHRTTRGGIPLTTDIDMVSAARLSASFPYVTPIAKAAWDDEHNTRRLPPTHVSDGGYFDNFGVLAAVEWIQDLLTTPPPTPQQTAIADRIGPIILIEIRAFGTEDLSGVAEEQLRQQRQREIVGRISECITSVEGWGDPDARPTTGWRSALIGPADGLLKMRSSTQVARNETEVQMLRQLYPERITHLVFQPLKGDWPFSWHMSPADIEALDAHADAVQNSPARHQLAKMLRQKNKPPTP